MKNKLRKIVDRTLICYVIIGVLNFLFCTALMFLLFNVCGFSDHIAPLFNYGLGSVIWYLSCKYIVFPGHESTWGQLLRFVLEVLVCYLLSYYVIAPLLGRVLLRFERVRRAFSFGGEEEEMISGNCQMTIGAISYAILNYFGQRYFVFSDRFAHLFRRAEEAPQEEQAGDVPTEEP